MDNGGYVRKFGQYLLYISICYMFRSGGKCPPLRGGLNEYAWNATNETLSSTKARNPRLADRIIIFILVHVLSVHAELYSLSDPNSTRSADTDCA